MVRSYKCKEEYEIYENIKEKKIIIWCISVSGLNAYIHLSARGANIIGFTDSFAYKKGEKFCGLRIFTIDELREMKDISIFVSTRNERFLIDILDKTDELYNADVYCVRKIYGPGHYDTESLTGLIEKDKNEIECVRKSLKDERSKEVFDNLLKYRVTNDRQLLEEVYEKEELQYFPDDVISFNSHEVFVDGGAYNGDTSCIFADKTDGVYDHIYLMEPDQRLYKVTEEYVKLKGLHDYDIIQKGAYSCSKKISFKNDFESGSSNINSSGDETIETISIDEMLDGSMASYIKMDIEGAEREALIGCSKTIEKWHPKLAISIYHLEDDLWKIPYMILKEYPFYDFYMRHYTRITTETVLYAVPK